MADGFSTAPVGCAVVQHRSTAANEACAAATHKPTQPAHPPNAQLCHLLRLRAIAVVSPEPEFEKTALWLRSLGAAEVLLDSGSLKVGAVVTCCSCGMQFGIGEGGRVMICPFK